VVFDSIRSCRWRLLGLAVPAALGWPPAPVAFPAWAPPGLPHACAAACETRPAPHTPGHQTPLRPVQGPRGGSLAKGKLLVAGKDLRDPNFSETVILLLEYNEQGAMGVVVNRATHIKLSELLPRVEGLEQRGDTIYAGGPVERSEILMLVRSAEEPEHSRAVFAGVYLSASAELLKRLAAQSPRDDAPFRVYSGYAGWAPGQLDAEVGQGAWHIFPATAAVVFSPRPEDLWREFIGRTTLRLARGLRLTKRAGLKTHFESRWGFWRFP
jgi:putative transcriptional regulator